MGVPLAALAIQPPPDPLRQIGRALAIKGAVQNQQYEQQAQPLRLQQAQQQIDEQNDLMQTRIAERRAYASAIEPGENGQSQINTDKLQGALANSGHGDAIPKILEGVTKYQESRADLSKKIQDLQTNSTDMIGHAAKAVQDSNYDPNVSHTLLDTMGNDPKIAQMRQLIDTNPQAFRQLIDSAVAASPAQQKLKNERDVANIKANASPEVREMNAWLARPENKGKTEADYQVYKGQLAEKNRVQGDIDVATNPLVQQGKVQVATATGQAMANIQQQAATKGNAALSNVPTHLVAPATAAAEKANNEYAEAKSVADRMQATMDAAKKGNVVSYQIIPQEGTLQITTSQGVHRINRTEIEQYAGGGSLWQRLEGHIGKQLTGKSIPDSVLKDMQDIQDIQRKGADERYNNKLNSVNQTYGSNFQPVKMKGLESDTQAHPFFSQFGGTARPQ